MDTNIQKYLTIYDAMQENIWYTAKELNISSQSLLAMVRRNLIIKQDGKPNKYCKINNIYIKIYTIIQKYETDFFTCFKPNRKIGMLCSLNKGKIVDCYEREYDISDVCAIEGKINGELVRTVL